jgi:hypothetical protein
MEKIEREIAYLTIAVEKTAGPRERQAWDWLMERIAAFKEESAETLFVERAILEVDVQRKPLAKRLIPDFPVDDAIW